MRVHNQKLMENTIRKLTWDSLWKTIIVYHDMIIDKRTGKVLGLEFDYTCCQNKF